MTDSRHCERCGKTFKPKRICADPAKGRFCCVACSNQARSTHGHAHTRLYKIWAWMKQRCLDENDRLYAYYGGRGIGIYPEWAEDFACFARDVGPYPGADFQIGRIDNDKGYEPGNIEWQTRSDNCRNRRSTIWVEYHGRRMSLVEACELADLPYDRVLKRIRAHGWGAEEALSLPKRARRSAEEHRA